MNSINKDNLYIKIAEFGKNNSRGFKKSQLIKALKLSAGDWEIRIIDEYINNAVSNNTLAIYGGGSRGTISGLDTMFFAIERGHDPTLIIKYDAFFNYVNYLEYEYALESSKEASKLARWSIWISVGLGTLSFVFELYQLFYNYVPTLISIFIVN